LPFEEKNFFFLAFRIFFTRCLIDHFLKQQFTHLQRLHIRDIGWFKIPGNLCVHLKLIIKLFIVKVSHPLLSVTLKKMRNTRRFFFSASILVLNLWFFTAYERIKIFYLFFSWFMIILMIMLMNLIKFQFKQLLTFLYIWVEGRMDSLCIEFHVFLKKIIINSKLENILECL